MPEGAQHSISKAIHFDLINIKSDAEESTHPIPKEINREIVHSWISAITKSTRDGDIRAVKLIYSTVQSLHLSTVYPPIYHALIFGHGKLGDISTMLTLYQLLLAHNLVTSSIVTTTLNCLALYRRCFEAMKLFDEYLLMSDCKPDINAFCMIFKHCSWTGNWHLSKQYFQTMLREYDIEPTALCFKYILETCYYCKPPKYEESLRILKGMKQWKIEPNIEHFAAVIRTMATPYSYIENPLSQDIMTQIQSNNDFEIYKFKLLHGRLFDHKSLSDSDLQRCLDLFHEMTDEYDITPNDKVFGIIFEAMDKAHNLEMALKYRKYWKHQFPTVRQQAFSLNRLISICSNIASWKDALDIYHSAERIECSEYTDSLQFEALHKVQPEIGVFNQMLRCAKQDISRQIFENDLDKKEAETLLLKRIEYIQSQMYHFRYSPNDNTWIFLLQSAAITQSADLCNRFLKRMFQFFMKPHQQKNTRSFMNWAQNENYYKELGDNAYKTAPNEFKDTDHTFSNCWDYYDVATFDCRHTVLQIILSALYWTQQIDRALMLYHDFYCINKKFTHWYNDNNNTDISIDLHGFDPAAAAVALLYIFQNEFEKVYYNLLSHDCDPQLQNTQNVNYDVELTLELNEIVGQKKKKKGKNLTIITGRGKGNEQGTSILRPWIRLFLQNECNPPIKSYIHPRNIGIVVLDSNDVLAYIHKNRHNFCSVTYRGQQDQ